MIEKKAITSVEIDKTIAWRWSIRAFDNDFRLTPEQITALCEAARWAPSSMNDQPWNFVIFDKSKGEEFWANVVNCLTPGNQGWAKNASCLIAVYSSQNTRDGSAANAHGDFDTGAASMNIYLQAVSMGLWAHPMGGFVAEKLNAFTNAPSGFTPKAVIAVGKHAELDTFDERIKRYELAPRKRLPLNENFFDGKWGEGINKE